MNKPWQPLFAPDVAPHEGSWRPIHYLGSKLRLLGPLHRAIDELVGADAAVCDLFAGSGTVAASLAGQRPVVAADIQEYSRVLCSAILNPTQLSPDMMARIGQRIGELLEERLDWAAALIEYEEHCAKLAAAGDLEALCDLIESASLIRNEPMLSTRGRAAQREVAGRVGHGLQSVPGTLVLRHFGGLYFSYAQAAALDAVLQCAREYESPLRETLLAAAIGAASEVVNTVGKQFAQPIQPRGSDGAPKRHLFAKIIRDRALRVDAALNKWLFRYSSLKPTAGPHAAVRGDFNEVLASLHGKVQLIYADPPYTREHYSRFYHVLETMCLGDEPDISTTTIRSDAPRLSRAVYRSSRHQSPFCIRSQAPGAFRNLFAGAKALGVPVVLSYSPFDSSASAHPRVMTMEQIVDIARQFYGSVEVSSAGVLSHSKLNTTSLHLSASDEAEMIVSCR